MPAQNIVTASGECPVRAAIVAAAIRVRDSMKTHRPPSTTMHIRVVVVK